MSYAGANPYAPVPTPTDPLEGAVLDGRYRVGRKLGQGGMGAVYEGEHVVIRRRVAIKCLLPQYASNPEVVARFHREAIAATSVGNEHIVEVTDFGRLPDGGCYMVLEYLDGTDLAHELARSGPMSVARTAHIVAQVCEALDAAHAKGIVHRDLKPANIYLVRRGDEADFVKVLDFGISKFLDAEEGAPQLTRTNAGLGTPHYMSPEQVMNPKAVDHRADVYAVGVLLFAMLTGRHPFDGETLPMLTVQIVSAAPPLPRVYRADLPAELERLILALLEKNPASRVQRCAQVREMLLPLRAVHGAPQLRTPPPAPTPSITPNVFAYGSGPLSPHSQVGATQQSSPTIEPLHASGPVGPAPSPPQRSMALPIGLGFLVFVGVIATGVTLGLRAKGQDAANTPAGTTGAVGAAGARAPSAAVAAPTVGEGAGTVSLSVRVEPATAVLTLDGVPIANPYRQRLARSGEVHRLEAHAPGYATYVRDLAYLADQSLELALQRGEGAAVYSAGAHPLVAAPNARRLPGTARDPLPPSPTGAATSAAPPPQLQPQPQLQASPSVPPVAAPRATAAPPPTPRTVDDEIPRDRQF